MFTGLTTGLDPGAVAESAGPFPGIDVGAIRWPSWDPSAQNQAAIWGTYLTNFPTRQPSYGLQSDASGPPGPYIHGGTIPGATAQSILDNEILAAVNGGLTFWAFNWYADANVGFPDLWQAEIFLSYHLWQSSPNQSLIKACLILADAWAGGPPPTTDFSNYATFITYWVSLMQDPNYYRIGGRPVVFLFTSGGAAVWTLARVNQLRTAVQAAGLGNPLIGYFGGNSRSAFAVSIGADFMCNYGPNGGAVPSNTHEPWSYQIAQDNSYLGPFAGIKTMPSAQLFNDRRCLAPSNGYVDLPLQVEAREHIKTRCQWIVAHPANAISAVLIYSWDEWAEGGPGIAPHVQFGSAYLDSVDAVMTGLTPVSWVERLAPNNFHSIPTGTWVLFSPLVLSPVTTLPQPFLNEVVYSETALSRRSFVVYGGTALAVYANFVSIGGFARVYIDGKLAALVDTFHALSRQVHEVIYSAPLPSTEQTLVTVECAGYRNNSGSTGIRVEIDMLAEYTATVAPQDGPTGYPAAFPENWAFGDTVMTGPGGTLVDCWESDYALSTPGTMTWTGYLGNVLSQATAGNKPVVNAVDVTLPGGHPSIQGNGTAAYLRNAAIARPAPGTTPTDVVSLVVNDSWGANRPAWVLGASAMELLSTGVTPTVSENNGASVNGTALTLGIWSRVIEHFTNSVADYLQVRATKVTGGNAGNNAGSRVTVFGNDGLTTFWQGRMAFFLISDGALSADYLASIDAYMTRKYTSQVIT